MCISFSCIRRDSDLGGGNKLLTSTADLQFSVGMHAHLSHDEHMKKIYTYVSYVSCKLARVLPRARVSDMLQMH